MEAQEISCPQGIAATVMDVVALTDKGRVRGHNEDVVHADGARGLAILADGMGGYNAGEVAAAMSVEHLVASLPAHGLYDMPVAAAQGVLAARIAEANEAIHQASIHQPKCSGMGTTLVLAAMCRDRLLVAHVGDSRAYLLRDGVLSRLTRDHSLVQEQIDCGLLSEADARYSLAKNLVTRALGVDVWVEPAFSAHEVREDDIFLLCSDGLNDMVEDPDIAAQLQAYSADPAQAAEQLVALANRHGGRDNVSVILLKIRAAACADASAAPEGGDDDMMRGNGS